MRLLIVVVLLVAAWQSVADAQTVVSTPGIHELRLPGSERRYTLVLPTGYDGNTPVPLVVSLHYGGRVSPYYGRGLLQQLILPALGELGAIVVAPDNAANGWANETAEAHVLELVDYIEAHYNVDPRRTLLTGYSMGAAGTWYLAPRHPDRFAAAIPMAGRPPRDSAQLDWQTPTYAINSRADELIELEPAVAIVEALQTKGAPVRITVIDGVTHYQIPFYRPHLQAAIEWLREVWSRD